MGRRPHNSGGCRHIQIRAGHLELSLFDMRKLFLSGSFAEKRVAIRKSTSWLVIIDSRLLLLT